MERITTYRAMQMLSHDSLLLLRNCYPTQFQ